MARKAIDMTSGPLFSKIWVFIFPLLITNIMQRLYSMADMLVIGRFAGSSALAAVGATTAFTNLIINILVNIAVGVSTVTAQAQGAKDKECVDRTVHTAMAISVWCSIVIAVIGIVGCKPILAMMGTPETILDKSTLYMRIILVGYPVSSIFNFGAAILRAKGDTKSPLAYLTIAGITNVVLNLFFVIVFGMDVDGVALATIISQFISAALVARSLLKDDYPYKLNLSKIKVHGAELKRILMIGVPIAAQSMMFSFSNMILQSAVNSFGEDAVAGAAACSNVDAILYVIVTAPAHASTIFTGQNIGAKKYSRVFKVMMYCMISVLAMGIPSCILFTVFGKELIALFNHKPDVIAAGMQIMQILAPTYFICGIMDTISGCLKGMNRSVQSMISAVSGLIGVRIMWIFTYFAAHRDLTVLYTSYPLSWAFVIIVDLIMFTVFYQKLKKSQ